jgi:hypothetical protein
MERATTKYDVVQTGVYQGNHQAKLGWYDKAGQFKVKSYPVKNKEGEEKFIPVSVTIGDDDTAVQFLLDWLKEITNMDYMPVKNPGIPPKPVDDGIPF